MKFCTRIMRKIISNCQYSMYCNTPKQERQKCSARKLTGFGVGSNHLQAFPGQHQESVSDKERGQKERKRSQSDYQNHSYNNRRVYSIKLLMAIKVFQGSCTNQIQIKSNFLFTHLRILLSKQASFLHHKSFDCESVLFGCESKRFACKLNVMGFILCST